MDALCIVLGQLSTRFGGDQRELEFEYEYGPGRAGG